MCILNGLGATVGTESDLTARSCTAGGVPAVQCSCTFCGELLLLLTGVAGDNLAATTVLGERVTGIAVAEATGLAPPKLSTVAMLGKAEDLC